MAETPHADTANKVENPTEAFGADDPGIAKRWHAEIKASGKYLEHYVKRADTAVKRFRDEQDNDQRKDSEDRFNVFWSTIETLKPLIYARVPKPEAARTFKDPDPIARIAAELIERTLQNLTDVESFEECMEACRDDYLLAGRGTSWWLYDPTFAAEETKPAEGEPFREVVAEGLICDFVHYKDFRHTPAPIWSQVTWVARRCDMTRAKLVKRFGKEKGSEVTLGKRPDHITEQDAKQNADIFERASIWEIWDKTKREVIWISEHDKSLLLDRKDDPLKLSGFFPCPKPLFGSMTNNKTVPIPDHHQWRHQLRQMDELTERISLMTEAVAVRGVYNSGIGEELNDLLSNRAENRMFPIDNWNAFVEGGGFKGHLDWLPLEQIVAAIGELHAQRDKLKQDFFEISGIADIMRGTSDPDETLGAQRLKANFGSSRTNARQNAMQKFVRGNLRIAAEIAGEHFSAETIEMMSNWMATKQGTPEQFDKAVELLKSDKMRGFRIDIETDSTIAPDREQERETRVAFLEAVTPFLQLAIPAAKEDPGLGNVLVEMLMFGVRGFAVGRQLETVFEQAISDMQGQGAEPDPALQLQAAQMELDKLRARTDAMSAQAKAEVDGAKAQIAAAKTEAEIAQIHAEIEVGKAKVIIEAQKLRQDRAQIGSPADDGAAALAFQERADNLDIERRRLDQKQQEIDDRRSDMEATRKRELIKLVVDSNFEPEVLDELEGEAGKVGASIRSAVEAVALGQAAQAQAMQQLAETHAAQAAAMMGALTQLGETMAELAKTASAPKRLIRDKNGQITGAEIAA